MFIVYVDDVPNQFNTLEDAHRFIAASADTQLDGHMVSPIQLSDGPLIEYPYVITLFPEDWSEEDLSYIDPEELAAYPSFHIPYTHVPLLFQVFSSYGFIKTFQGRRLTNVCDTVRSVLESLSEYHVDDGVNFDDTYGCLANITSFLYSILESADYYQEAGDLRCSISRK